MHLTFGEGGSATPHLIEGWANPEPGFCWSTGEGAALLAVNPPGKGDLFLELTLNPFNPPDQRTRALRITVNGRQVGADSLEGHGTVGYPIPADITDPCLVVALHHAAAPSPAALGLSTDDRSLGFMLFGLRLYRQPHRALADVTALPPLAVPLDSAGQINAIRAVTGLAPGALAATFENLGHNHEFGVLQRLLGTEPAGLLRFAATTLDDLLAALDNDFAGMGDDITVSTHPGADGKLEYLVHEERHRIILHSGRTTETATETEIAAQYRADLPALASQFRARLAQGPHIFVVQRPGQLTHSQAVPLWNRLQARGPNALLYVDQDSGLPPGAVEQHGPGLFHGRLASMAPPDNVGLLDLRCWLSLCANAYRLWLAARPKPVVS